MLWTVAYSDSTSSAQTDTDIPLVSDPSVTILNNHPIFPNPYSIMWAYALGLLMQRVRISAPRLRPITRPLISPVDQSATPTENLRIAEWWRRPLMLNPVEEIQMLRTNTTAVAERDFVVLTVGDGQRNVPQGDCFTVRGTTAFSATVATWSPGTITLDDTLQVGRYSIVGLRVENAGGVAGRLIFPGVPVAGASPVLRPGVKVAQSVADEDTWWMRYGVSGEYGQFESFALPQIDMMVATVAANPTVLMDIVPVRIGARAG